MAVSTLAGCVVRSEKICRAQGLVLRPWCPNAFPRGFGSASRWSGPMGWLPLAVGEHELCSRSLVPPGESPAPVFQDCSSACQGMAGRKTGLSSWLVSQTNQTQQLALSESLHNSCIRKARARLYWANSALYNVHTRLTPGQRKNSLDLDRFWAKLHWCESSLVPLISNSYCRLLLVTFILNLTSDIQINPPIIGINNYPSWKWSVSSIKKHSFLMKYLSAILWHPWHNKPS